MRTSLPRQAIACLCLLFLGSAPALAAWTLFGGPEPLIRNVRIFNNTPSSGTNTVYVATLGQGVLKGVHPAGSDNMVYTQMNTGLPSLRIRAVQGPTATDLFAATEAHGVYVTFDGGANWSPTPTRVPCRSVRNMQVISQIEVWVGTDCRYNSGVYHTPDGGFNWYRRGAGTIPDDAAVNSISVNGSVVLVATANYGMWRSDDSGVNWYGLNYLMPHPVTFNVLQRSNSSELIAALEGSGVFRSNDGGANWTMSNTGLPSTVLLAGISKQNAMTYYVGVDKYGIYRSTDGGASWSPWGNSATADTRLLFARNVTPDGGTPNRFYIPTMSGLLWTNDAGTTFADREMPQSSVNSIAMHPNGVTAYATSNTLFKILNVRASADDESNALPMDNGLPGTTIDGQVAVTPSNPDILYATTNYHGLNKSVDGGANWSRITTLPSSFHNQVRFTLMDGTPTTIWAGLTNPLGGPTSGGIYVSFDSGATWTDKGSTLTGKARSVNRISTHAATPNTLFAATADGLFRSVNGGDTWAQAYFGVDGGGTPLPVAYVARDPTNANIVYIATEHVNADGTVLSTSGISKSFDGGYIFSLVLPGRARQVRVDGNGEVTALFHHDLAQPPLMRSKDAGATWQSFSDGLPATDARTLAQSNDAARRTVAVSTGAGIFILERIGQNDFNVDGHPDIVWSNTANGATYVWHMNGTPPALVSDAFIAQIDPSWKVQGVADFNGDGKPDLVWRNTANGNTYVWYMNGASFISDAFLFGLPPEWVIQGVADFNADGKPDFLMRNTNSGVGFAWFFNDNVAIGDQFLFGIDPAWKVEQVGDVNADNQPDLLFRNMSSGLAFAWYTQYSGGNLSLAGSSSPIFSIDPVWEIVQLDDWNGDASPDLLFRNASSGVVFVWYMTGTTLGGSDYVIQIDPSWEIVPRR